MTVGLPESAEQVRFAPFRALRGVFSGVGQLLQAADRLRAEDAEQDQLDQAEQESSPRPWDPYQPRSVRIITNEDPAAGQSFDNSAAASAVPPESAARISAESGRNVQGARASTSTRAPKSGTGDGRGRGGRGASQPPQPRFRSLDSTGNVRVLSDRDIADMAEDDLDRRVLEARAQASAAADVAPDRPTIPAVVSASAARSTQVGSVAQASPGYEAAGAPSEWPYDLAAEQTQVEPSRAARELPIAGYDEFSLPSLRARLRNLDVAQLRQLVLYEISHAYRPDVVTMFERRIAKLQDEGDD